ncbi:Fungalysin metallopeptidase-domain-containing protein [Mycena rebaudengoi]|nr:Fungalysin metallopeptidase-domain-containing protein [Mycena rebaudengoi]
MPAFNKFFTTVLLAVVYASSVMAAPPEPGFASARHSTHRKRTLPNGLTLESYHPPSTFETFGAGIDHPLPKRAAASLQESSVAFIQNKLGLKAEETTFTSGYTGATARYSYAAQTHKGISFANAVANVAFNKDDKVVAFGSSFVTPKTIADSTPSISFEEARATAEKQLAGSHEGLPASKLEYLAKKDGSAALVHSFQVNNEESGAWYEAFVDAHSGELLSVVDFVAQASYLVLPIMKETVPEGFEERIDPQDLVASPNGWHTTADENSTFTSGNNAISFQGNAATGRIPQTNDGLVFEYVQDPAQEPSVAVNVGAAVVNNFYIVNTVHDITYRYGFTEAAFNFQNDNFGLGGLGHDRVSSSVQDSFGTNNAAFVTLPDGQPGFMRMFEWTFTTPHRDGAVENDIVVHENTHGVTNRMTGGGTARCLQTAESAGLGEGWSDAMAEWTEQKNATIVDYTLGQYVLDTPAGIRTHPYSTSKTTNPLTYASVATTNEVHKIGEVWANMLHNMYAALVEKYGFSSTAFTDPDQTEGNAAFMHLFIDALPLQPCNPTFPSARDAWLQADVNRYAGANKCLIWTIFASRGLGVGAADYVDSTAVPEDCVAA